ncbi:Major facilitator superfamily domain general substrate transporter [Pyrenophora seminiperda CCB06]|uniref:Major facilitator superfamily domain general substrate transporter n=1 Tax=Pyrenophora seminiperda CCB06 TaxID=1302712 RepID=A0A3M7LZ03_9PLEO|nr:Major facilitator superfamily domain general substrate transporter [Pyrenophora seminiperda CCB06]
MSAPLDQDMYAVAEAHQPSVFDSGVVEKAAVAKEHDIASSLPDEDGREPTEDEMNTLRRVSGKIPWTAMTVTFVEFCERFSYYGTTAVFVNFIQQPRPFSSRTGAIVESSLCYDAPGWSKDACLQAGGLGQDQQVATGLTTFNQFWAYIMPLVGGYAADTYLGRYLTIQYSIAFAILGHIILICSSIPTVMDNPKGALGCFVAGLIMMGVGTGGFKANISPLLAEQIPQTRPIVKTLKSGERVIVDPQVTYSRIYLYFYMMINAGSLSGGIGMVYAEKYIGFWLSYALPTFMFFLAPIVLIVYKKKYVLAPPTESVLSKSFKALKLASKGCWSVNPAQTYRNFQRDDFWDRIKPSHLGSSAPAFLEGVDDVWIDQVARGFNACKVFFWMPLYWLAYNQMVNNLTSQSATLQLNGVPNDLINNLNPLTLVLFIPIIDKFVYPAIRKTGFQFTPIKRIAWGFFVASAAMVSSAVLQYYIYKLSPCPRTEVNSSAACKAPINVWVQAVPYCLVAFSEIFASVTSLEYAFTKAPGNMRGLVMGVNLVQNAFSAALGQALVPLAEDPLLIWNYTIVAVLAFVGGIGFWLTWRDLDAREDELNMIEESTYKGRTPITESERDHEHS